MKIENWSEPITMAEIMRDINYNTDTYVVCCIEPLVRQSAENILPLFAVYRGEIVAVYEPERNKIFYQSHFKKSIDSPVKVTQFIHERFVDGQLFRVDKFKDNERMSEEYPYFCFGNSTTAIEDSIDNNYEFIDVIPGDLNLELSKFTPSEKDATQIIVNSYKNFNCIIYIDDSRTKNLWGPFGVRNMEPSGIVNLKSLAGGNVYQFDKLSAFESLLVEIDVPYRDVFISRKMFHQKLSTADCRKYRLYDSVQVASWLSNKIHKHLNLTEDDKKSWQKIVSGFSQVRIDEEEDAILIKQARSLIAKAADEIDTLDEIVALLPQTKNFRNKVAESEKELQVTREKNRLLSERSQKLADEVEKKEEVVRENSVELRKLEEQIEKARASIEEYAKGQESTLREKLRDLNERYEAKKLEVEELSNANELILDITALKEQARDLNLKNEIIRSQKSELEDQLDHLRQEFIDAQGKARQRLEKLIEAKTHFDFIQGKEFSTVPREQEIEFVPQLVEQIFNKTDNVTAEQQLLESTQNALRETGRRFTSHFIANLLICIHQNMFTIFSGAPGTGKTSLSRILARILVPHERIREISVSRGWTSQKDLIGFMNPISKKFVESNTNLFSLLQLLDREWKTASHTRTPLAVSILDEANLSPIEHYWSAFYNMTDTVLRDSPFELCLGENSKVCFANNLKFIGTMNTDMTTEPLSERVLDRVNVIRLPDLDVIEEADVAGNIELLGGTGMSLQECIEIFDLPDFGNQDRQFRETEEIVSYSKFIELKKYFRALNVPINARIQKAFRQYCFTASKFMNDELRPLDYFIDQRLLPKVNLQGKKWQQPLKELKGVLNETFTFSDSVSLDTLKRIATRGDEDQNYFNYNYFLALY